MTARRILVIGTILTGVLAVAAPASAKGRTAFVVSGGDLKHPVTFTTDDLTVAGEWMSNEADGPSLSGLHYQVKLYDPDYNPSHSFAEWIYFPEASGALQVQPKTFAGNPVRPWEAFTPAFNEAFRRAIHSYHFPVDSIAVPFAIMLIIVCVALGMRSARRAARVGNNLPVEWA